MAKPGSGCCRPSFDRLRTPTGFRRPRFEEVLAKAASPDPWQAPPLQGSQWLAILSWNSVQSLTCRVAHDRGGNQRSASPAVNPKLPRQGTCTCIPVVNQEDIYIYIYLVDIVYCIYICKYLYVYIYICVYVFLHICQYIILCICVCMWGVCVYVCVCTCVCVRAHFL